MKRAIIMSEQDLTEAVKLWLEKQGVPAGTTFTQERWFTQIQPGKLELDMVVITLEDQGQPTEGDEG